jgi:hypothetical protein
MNKGGASGETPSRLAGHEPHFEPWEKRRVMRLPLKRFRNWLTDHAETRDQKRITGESSSTTQ